MTFIQRVRETLERNSAPDLSSGCLLWTSTKESKGYGQLPFVWSGHSRRTHRAAWIVANGPIPAGMHVCHKCDVRACINPDHLFIGTNRDNVADKVAKGRAIGFSRNRHPMTKISEKEAARICARKSVPDRILAREYGVCRQTISRIQREGKENAR